MSLASLCAVLDILIGIAHHVIPDVNGIEDRSMTSDHSDGGALLWPHRVCGVLDSTHAETQRKKAQQIQHKCVIPSTLYEEFSFTSTHI